ncbi:MAG: zf-HC2 domain-containing protein [Bryobacteraceae bacterium]
MDHQYATENYAVEQYLLGEMNRAEREEFEEHYFSCPECADAVRSGTYFADNAQLALKGQLGRPTVAGRVVEMKARPRPTLWQRLALPVGVAAAVLLAAVGYQNLRVEQPQLLARSVIHPAARGTEDVIQLKPGQKTAVLRMDLNSDQAYPYYTVDLETQSGKAILHQVTEAPPDGALEISEIAPGLYEVSVRGQSSPSAQPGPVVERSKFLVKK